MSIFINWFLMILGVFGAIELTGMITIWLHRPRVAPPCMMVVPLQGRVENPEQLLRYIQAVAQWSPESQRAILVDLGLEAESCQICERLCEEDPRVEFYTREQLALICKPTADVLY